MNNLTLIPDASPGDAPQISPGWRFSVIPPKDVRARWYSSIRAIRRPAGTLAVPAIATTGVLHFTGVLRDGDTVMALGLTALTVGYDAVIAICRTWQKTTLAPACRQPRNAPARRAA